MDSLICRQARTDRGFTLVELIISSALIVLLTGIAAPGIAHQWHGWQLRQLTELVLTDLARLREYAIYHEKDIFIRPQTYGWCAGYDDSLTSSCSLSDVSLPERFLFRHTSGGQFVFTRARGFARSGGTTFYLSSSISDAQVYIVISVLGRIRACSDSVIRGVPRCE